MTLDTAALADLAARLTEGCEPGPWHAEESGDHQYRLVMENAAGDASFPDPEDWAAMFNALPALLSEIESLRKVRDAAAALADHYDSKGLDGSKAYIVWAGLNEALAEARAALVSEEGEPLNDTASRMAPRPGDRLPLGISEPGRYRPRSGLHGGPRARP